MDSNEAIDEFQALDLSSEDPKELAKIGSALAMRRLIEMATCGRGELAYKACIAVLDRALGKPPQALEHQGPGGAESIRVEYVIVDPKALGDKPV